MALALTCLYLSSIAPQPIRGTVQEVVHVLRNGRIEAWDGHGKPIPGAKDPLANVKLDKDPWAAMRASSFQPKPQTPAYSEVYRVVIKLDPALKGYGLRNGGWYSLPHHLPVEAQGRGKASGLVETLSLTVPRGETGVTMEFKIANGPYRKYFEGPVPKKPSFGGRSNHTMNGKLADVYDMTVPYMDEEQGVRTVRRPTPTERPRR